MLVLNGQYEIREAIGRGGMGVVYKAFDRKQKRPVAVKTIRDVPDRAAIQMFRKECGVLAALSHPCIVPIYDIGEYEEDGEKKPYFVMPLLPGNPLDKLISEFSHRLTVERAVDIVAQTCRGLQAAHDKGVIHRDLKPSNIFVLDDNSVTIIDFGVAHMVDTRSTMGQKGSLLYMSPEQLRCEPLSVRSDLFSLGVVCYEAFTRKRPFEVSDDNEVIDAILRKVPPPASEVNPSVNTTLSRVVHKAMAKQPWSRFSSAREFAEALQKALRNEPLEIFDTARIQPRVLRARKAFDQGDLQFATEIVGELEAEGHLDPEISQLRNQIDRTARQKRIQQLLESARTRFEEEEYLLALQKVQEVLEMDPENGSALGLKKTIENTRTERTVEEWLRLAHQHVDNHAYTHASEALHKVLELQPQESRALQLLNEVEVREQDYLRIREEKSRVFNAAQKAWQDGEISTALNRMEAVLDLDHRAPDSTSPEQAARYEGFYKQVRSEHDALKTAYAEASQRLLERDFPKALALCDEYLRKYPAYAPFQMLKFDVEEQERQALSAFIAETDRQVESEPDLDKRVGILKEAVARYPGEAHFERALKLARQKQELVNAIVAKARYHEERGQFAEALGQWEILRTVFNQYGGLAFEIERVVKRRDQQRSTEAKARRIEEIDRQIAAGDFARALQLVADGRQEFPSDPELASLEEAALQGKERGARIDELVARGKELCGRQEYEPGLEALRDAYHLDSSNRVTKAIFLTALLDRARQLLENDWRQADPLIEEAFDLDPNHTQAKSLRVLSADRKKQESVDTCLSKVRRLQSEGNLPAAQSELERGLMLHPGDTRLTQFQASLGARPTLGPPRPNRQHDLDEMRRLYEDSQYASDPAEVGRLSQRVQDIESRYGQDAEFQPIVREVRRRLETYVATLPPQRMALAAASASSSVAAIDHPPEIPVEPPAAAEGATLPGNWKRLVPWALVLAGLAVAAAVVIMVVRRKPLPAPGSASLTVKIDTLPSGARVRIAGVDKGVAPLAVPMDPGRYLLEVQKDGYEPASQWLFAREGMTKPETISLRPLPAKLRLVTGNLHDPQILWDGQPTSKSANAGEWSLDTVDPGTHKLEVSSGGGKAIVSFQVTAGALPTFTDPPAATELNVVAVSSFPGQVHVQASSKPATVKVDDGPDTSWNDGGVDFPALADGIHSLSWADLAGSAKENFEVGAGPELLIIVGRGHAATKTPVVAKAIPPATPAPAPVNNAPQPDSTQALYNRAYDAYQHNDDTQALTLAKQILQSNPDHDGAKRVRDGVLFRQGSAIDSAIGKGDLKAARDNVNTLVAQLPDNPQVQSLQNKVQQAEQAEEARRHPVVAEKPVLTLPVVYSSNNNKIHGTLTVVGHHIRFTPESPGPSLLGYVDAFCSDVKEVKEKGRILGIGQQGFKIQMKQGGMYEFQAPNTAPEQIRAACRK